MVKGLGCSIKAVVENRKINGLSLHRMMDPLTHNQFFDETMIM
jgi:hypothetical protein